MNLYFELLQLDETSLPDYKKVKRKDAQKCHCIIQEFGLYQLIDMPTHIQDGTLDVVIAQNESLINKCSVGLQDEVCPTDHFPIHINFTGKPLLESKKITVKRRNLYSIDNPVLIEDLKKTGIEDFVASNNDPNKITSSLMSSVTQVLDKNLTN